MKPVDIVGLHLEATSGTPVILLREHDAPHRVLPIFVGGNEAAAIALALSGQSPPRPLPYDLMAALVDSLDARVDRVEVTELRDGAFLAELAVTGPAGGRRLDTRPSDAIALALRVHAPVFVSETVLGQAGAVLSEGVDEQTIDAQVAEFRTRLDELTLDDLFPDHDPGSEVPGDSAESTDQDGSDGGAGSGAP